MKVSCRARKHGFLIALENITEELPYIIPSEMNPPINVTLVTDMEGLLEVKSFLERTEVFGFDTETNVTDDFVERKIRTIQVGDRDTQFVIDLLAFAGKDTELLRHAQGGYGIAAHLCFQEIIDTIKPYLENHSKLKVGVNLQFDYEVMVWCLGIRLTGLWDCQRAEQNIHAGLVHFMHSGFWGMSDMVPRYTGKRAAKDEQKTFTLEGELTDSQIVYGGLDVRLPLAIRSGQLRTAQQFSLLDAIQIDNDAISPFGDMFLTGIGIDEDAWRSIMNDNISLKRRVVKKMDAHFLKVVGSKHVAEEDLRRLDELEGIWRDTPQRTKEEKELRQIRRAAYMQFRKGINERVKAAKDAEGEAAINYGSPAQLLAALRKTGYGVKSLPDTNDKSLTKAAKFPNLTVEKAFAENGGALDYPVIDLIRLYRTIDKLIDTYGEMWISPYAQGGHLHPVTRRIHSSINLLGAATGRTSSSNPNIQNIPKEKKYRHAFKARPGYKILTIDYSGAELRILAFMSREPVWLEAFQKGWDVHSVGAEMLYRDRWKSAAVHESYVDAKGKTVKKCAYYYDDHKKCKCPEHEVLRDNIKSVNFGLAYGLQEKGLAEQLGISVTEAGKLLHDYKAAFPTVMKFLDTIGQHAKMKLEARTVVKRRRRWEQPTWELAEYKLRTDKKLAGKPITQDMIRKRYVGMYSSIEREGKNMPIQGTNSDLTKRAMFLAWKDLFPKFGASFINMVHDEIVVECPEAVADDCFKFVSECMVAAGAEWIHDITMEVEGAIDDMWTK